MIPIMVWTAEPGNDPGSHQSRVNAMRTELLFAFLLLIPIPAMAQHNDMPTMQPHNMHGARQHMMKGGGPNAPQQSGAAREAGQAAFAAIQEIVALLDADPSTDWSKVNIEGLRQHLTDMDNVTLRSKVVAQPVKGGTKFVVTGEGDVPNSIRRMVAAHAATMNGTGSWAFMAEEVSGGAALTVTSDKQGDVVRINALGFIGVMTRGMHHQEHHLMIAKGLAPHG